MDGTGDRERSAPPTLRAELERSRDDLSFGRVQPLRPVLTAVHGRASRRAERRQEREEGRKVADPG